MTRPTEAICEEVTVYMDRAELFGQVVARPGNIAPWTWYEMWRERRIDADPYRHAVEVFGQVLSRPSRVAPSQWYSMWGDLS